MRSSTSLLATRFLAIGAFAVFLAVLSGAFGAHALRRVLAFDLMAIYQTGVEYHFYAAFGLVTLGLFGRQGARSAPLFAWAGWLMLAGLVLFSGSLYLLALTGSHVFGFVTPLGGVALLAAWVLFGVAAWRGTADAGSP